MTDIPKPPIRIHQPYGSILCFDCGKPVDVAIVFAAGDHSPRDATIEIQPHDGCPPAAAETFTLASDSIPKDLDTRLKEFEMAPRGPHVSVDVSGRFAPSRPEPLTDGDLDDIAAELHWGKLRLLVAEVRRQRALLRKLVLEEGCPWKEYKDTVFCAFCDGPEIEDETRGEIDTRYQHAPDCIWFELEREVARS